VLNFTAVTSKDDSHRIIVPLCIKCDEEKELMKYYQGRSPATPSSSLAPAFYSWNRKRSEGKFQKQCYLLFK